MEELYLAFIKLVGTDLDGHYVYRFSFTTVPETVWGEYWNVLPCSIVPNLEPDNACIKKTYLVSIDYKLNLVTESSCFSMQDCIDWVVAMGWFDIDNPNTTDSNGRTISFRFGEKFETVKGKLDSLEIEIKLEAEKQDTIDNFVETTISQIEGLDNDGE